MKEIESKIISIPTTSERDFIKNYLLLFNGTLKLTGKELDVLAEIVRRYLDMYTEVKEPYLSQLVLSAEYRREMCNNLDIESANLNNRLASLREKGVFVEGERFELNSMLIPVRKIIFKFEEEEENLKEDNLIDIGESIIEDNELERKVIPLKEEENVETST